MILALDLSTRTGWALGTSPRPKYGVWHLGTGGNHGRYFSALAAMLESFFAVTRPSLVVFEAPLPPAAPKMIRSTVATARVLIGLAAVTEMICVEQGVPCEEAECRTARARVIGRQPRRGKDGVMDWARSAGYHPQDDNAADALVLLTYRQLLEKRAPSLV